MDMEHLLGGDAFTAACGPSAIKLIS